MSSRIEIIAEIAQAHDGSLGMAHSYIEALVGTGVDTIKFQMHIADAESSEFEQFRIPFSYEDKTRYDYWKRMEFTPEQWVGLKEHCESNGFRFLCSPFSVRSVQWMENMNVERYKIASGETANFLMLDYICRTGKPILLSSGMSTIPDLERTVDFILRKKGNFAGVFQCTTAYPTPPENYGLNVLSDLRKTFGVAVGLSDHSGDIAAPLAAAALGAEMLEMHVTFDKKMFGPDSGSSLTIQEFKAMAEAVRKIETALSHPVDKFRNNPNAELKAMFGKSLSVNSNLREGHVLKMEDLESRKPAGKGISASDYEKAIGAILRRDINKNQFLQEEDLV